MYVAIIFLAIIVAINVVAMTHFISLANRLVSAVERIDAKLDGPPPRISAQVVD